MTEEDGCALLKLPATDACDETGHGFPGVRRIEKEGFGPRRQLYRLARLGGGDGVTGSNKSVVYGNAHGGEAIGRETQELCEAAEQHSHVSFEHRRGLIGADPDDASGPSCQCTARDEPCLCAA